MISLKSLLCENANVVLLTKEDATEVWHKLGLLADNEDLQIDYGITSEQASILVDSLPKNGGQWTIPDWGFDAVKGEMEDHITVLRDIARDAFNGGETGQSLRIAKQAKRLEKMFGLSN